MYCKTLSYTRFLFNRKVILTMSLNQEDKEILMTMPLWFQRLREIHLRKYGVDLYNELDKFTS